jgi:hypothetical protein
MTEAEWLGATDPWSLLTMLPQPVSDRKLRLFVAAVHRRLWHLLSGLERRVPDAAEQFLEGKISQEQFDAAYRDNPLFPGDDRAPRPEEYPVERALAEVEYVTEYGYDANGPALVAAQADLVRDVFGNPLRPLTFDPAWRTWNGGVIPRLAQAIYDERGMPEGVLDTHRLGELADALETAGCASEDLLSHLRAPGPHVLGCWAVDLALGRNGG